MVLRRAEPGDVEALDRLAIAAGLRLDAVAELGNPTAELWVAGALGQPSGFALGWVVADELEVLDVAVHEAERRRGLGRSLVRALFEAAEARGARSAYLEVRASNTAAQALYVALGFVRDGERRGYYGDGEDAWLFRRMLAASSELDSP
ncbi:MAG TPA: ribosomal protein S18-alanine N-acetyltransferase [Polyangiaceae bacterium]|nr:ribosomal protein S18-alanine N-acetyltransferase [Polyangiaceae bacterium]